MGVELTDSIDQTKTSLQILKNKTFYNQSEKKTQKTKNGHGTIQRKKILGTSLQRIPRLRPLGSLPRPSRWLRLRRRYLLRGPPSRLRLMPLVESLDLVPNRRPKNGPSQRCLLDRHANLGCLRCRPRFEMPGHECFRWTRCR